MVPPPQAELHPALSIASRYLWVMGPITFVLGLLPVMMRGTGGFPLGELAVVGAVLTLLYFGPALVYCVSAIYIKQGARWAAGIPMLPAFLHVAMSCVFVLIGFIAIESGSSGGAGLVLMAGAGALCIAFIGLIAALSDAGRAMRDSGPPKRGFEPVMSRTVERKGAEDGSPSGR